MRKKYIPLLIIFVVCLAMSVVLTFKPISEICDVTQGCDVVQHSIYSTTFGIKNSAYGIIIFAALSLFTFHHINAPRKYKRKIIHVSLILGSIVALYFIYLQMFVLNAFCKYCMVVDIGLIIGLTIIIFRWKH